MTLKIDISDLFNPVAKITEPGTYLIFAQNKNRTWAHQLIFVAHTVKSDKPKGYKNKNNRQPLWYVPTEWAPKYQRHMLVAIENKHRPLGCYIADYKKSLNSHYMNIGRNSFRRGKMKILKLS